MDSSIVNDIRNNIRIEERTCEEALQILSEFVDLRLCTLEEVDEGLVRVMEMNCTTKGTEPLKIRAFEIVASERNRENLYIDKPAHLLIEDQYQHSECDNDGVIAMFLLFRGYDAGFDLTEEQRSNANEELFASLRGY